MATYVCRVILFMISLCWGNALHSVFAQTTKILDKGWREGLSVVEEQSCPTWYLETKHNAVTRCVCGDTIGGFVMCDYAMQKTRISAGLCMSYNVTINDTIVGRCAFNYRYPDTQIFYVTLPNKQFHVQWFEPNWSVV